MPFSHGNSQKNVSAQRRRGPRCCVQAGPGRGGPVQHDLQRRQVGKVKEAILVWERFFWLFC